MRRYHPALLEAFCFLCVPFFRGVEGSGSRSRALGGRVGGGSAGVGFCVVCSVSVARACFLQASCTDGGRGLAHPRRGARGSDNNRRGFPPSTKEAFHLTWGRGNGDGGSERYGARVTRVSESPQPGTSPPAPPFPWRPSTAPPRPLLSLLPPTTICSPLFSPSLSKLGS